MNQAVGSGIPLVLGLLASIDFWLCMGMLHHFVVNEITIAIALWENPNRHNREHLQQSGETISMVHFEHSRILQPATSTLRLVFFSCAKRYLYDKMVPTFFLSLSKKSTDNEIPRPKYINYQFLTIIIVIERSPGQMYVTEVFFQFQGQGYNSVKVIFVSRTNVKVECFTIIWKYIRN